jgi:alginate O-acetyltransferase complex protein AlgJ
MSRGASIVRKSVLVFLAIVLFTPVLLTVSLVAANRGVPAPDKDFISRIWLVKEPALKVTAFTAQSWMNRTFQDKFAAWFNHTFFLRKPFILLNNQAYYDCFGKSYMLGGTIVVGKQRCLYEEYYIRDYCGLTRPLGTDSMETLVRHMRDVQSLFGKRGVPFVVLVTPSKPSVYPEYIPDDYVNAGVKIPRDYDVLVALLERNRIQYVDGRKLTLKAKRENDAPVFCAGSTHWNSLGVLPTLDALVARIGVLGNCPRTALYIESMTTDKKPEGTDADLARGLHLLFPPLRYRAPHPVIRAVRPDSSARSRKGSLAIVGGSFCEMMLDILEKNAVFDSVDFYYYFRTALRTRPYDGKRESAFSTDSIEWGKDFLNKDAVVLEINEAGLHIGHVQMFLREALERLSGKDRLFILEKSSPTHPSLRVSPLLKERG